MAVFSASVDNITSTTAIFSASVTGGDSSYTDYRYVWLELSDGSIYEIASDAPGADSIFTFQITGLSAGQTYTWTATLGYVGDGSIIYTSYVESGWFATQQASSAIFSASINSTGLFNASLTNGDSSYSNYRYVWLELSNGATYEIASNEFGGASSTFTLRLTGLSSGRTYTWTATLGYVDDYGDIVYTSHVKTGTFTKIGHWDWYASNGEATAAQTEHAYNILLGTAPANDFSYLVWNDLVNKVVELLVSKNLIWSDTYAKYENTIVVAGDHLSAVIYNSVLNNIEQLASIDRSYVVSGDRITGSHIVDLTEALNTVV